IKDPAAADALGAIGEAAIGPVALAFESSDPKIRAGAIEAMTGMRSDSPQRREGLLKGLDDKVVSVRKKTVLEFARLRKEGAFGMDTLTRLRMSDPSDEVRAAATAAVQKISLPPDPNEEQTGISKQ